MQGDDALGSDFRKLWAALSASLVGSEITTLALPLIAALSLDATAVEMGLLAAAGLVPFLLFSLPAGVFVDRHPRRRLLIATDLGSALLLLSLPPTLLNGGPSFLQLVLVAFGLGTFGVISEAAHYAYVPTLVGRSRLMQSNSRLQVSHSAAEAGGPGIGGLLIQLLSAPLAVLIDAISFLVSAFFLAAIRQPEPAFARPERSPSLRRAAGEGIRMLLGHRLLRPIVVIGAGLTFVDGAILALYVLYATRELGLDPATIGLVFAAGGVGAIPGAALAPWAGNRFGVGRAIAGGWVLGTGAFILVPLAGGPTPLVVALLAAASALGGLVGTVANIHQWTLRQTVTPDELAGRVTASHRLIVWGAAGVGAVAGGVLGGAVGLRPALFISAAAGILVALLSVASPLRELREHPTDEVSTSGPDRMRADDPAMSVT